MRREIMPDDGASAILESVRDWVGTIYLCAAVFTPRIISHLLFLKEADHLFGLPFVFQIK